MAHELSFTERYNKMMGVALLRLGYLGEPSYYGGRGANKDAYTKFGIRRVDSYADSLPSLTAARCPSCKGKVEINTVYEEEYASFGGTFADHDDKYHIAQGKLVCVKDSRHTDRLHDYTTVSVSSTIAEMVCLLDDIATEMGY